MNGSEERDAARSDIETLTRRSTELIERVERDTTEEERVRKPSSDAWSLTEVAQHLALVAGGILRTAHPAKRGASVIGAAKSALLRGVLRSRLKIRAPVAGIVPRPGVTWSDAQNNVRRSLEGWKAFVDGNAFEQTGFRHPFVGSLTPAETTGFLVEHFDHHMRQVERLFAGLKV